MLGLVLAAVIGLGDRTAFVGAGEQARYSAYIADLAIKHDAATPGQPCAAAATVTAVSGEVIAPADFPASVVAEPVPGMRERVRVEACDHSMVHNILVYRTPTGIGTLVLVPGESLAGPRLMADAVGLAPQAVPEFTKGACADPAVKPVGVWGEARVSSPPDADGVWMERWPLTVCGIDRTLLITFKPLPGGGTDINLSLSWR